MKHCVLHFKDSVILNSDVPIDMNSMPEVEQKLWDVKLDFSYLINYLAV